MRRLHEEQQETELSAAEPRRSQLPTETRDYEEKPEQSCFDVRLKGFTNPYKSGQGGRHSQFNLFFYFDTKLM